MKANKLKFCSLTALSLILGTLVAAPPTNSQAITPANDGTGTTINQNGNQFNIEGGTRSGANLFHSFDKFNVPTNQTANFLTTPDTRNILGRVTGGNASIINGLIQVIGGNSNLFLMNPAGIMFGPNATLNIPASFSVTTATGIGFDNNNFWFQAMGTNDYSNLVGNPSGYRFNVSNPGAIVNEGNLTLNPGENFTLLGGTVINTGELSTAGGNITIAAVEGGSVLRISQPEHLLSLEVETFHGTSLENGENTDITPLSLPQLLTGGEETHASSVIVNANGEIVLTDSNTLVADTPGTAITSGNIDVSIPPNPPYEGGNVSSLPLGKGDGRGIGGQVNVLGDRVALIDTNINANGTNGGGNVLIGGDFQGNGIVPNSQQTFINNNSIISADAINNGDGGRVIVWSDGITNFAGNISAKGGQFSGNGGFVEVSGKQELIFDGNVNVSAAFGTPGTILLDPENLTVGESENSDNSETESTENLESSETENSENNSEAESTENTQTVENNSEVESTENTDNSETEIAENSPTVDSTNTETTETVANNSEVESTENTDNSETEIAENTENIETETPIDPFAQNENADVTISAENIEQLEGDVILQADNDITINQKIETESSVELKAGRSININADIDTSVGNGNIDLLGNNDEMNLANRNEGAASINQLDGTTLNAGSGTINIELGNLGEVGDINLGSLTTTGEVFVNANGGNIARVSDSSTINAGSVLFQTSGNGGIGLPNAPLQLNVENLEAVSGSGGVFFDVGNVNIGDVSEDVNGIVTAGGDIDINSDGNVTLTEAISTIETVENNSEAEISPPSQEGLGGIEAEISPPSQGGLGGIEATEVTDTSGAINIEATGDIVATGSGIKGGGESVSLSATNIRINDEFDETSGDADVKLEATNDITVEDIEDDVLEFQPGSGEIEFRADVDGDGIGVVEMLDNEADVGSDPNTFENGADTIKTNGRSLTIAGAEIILGNIDTSGLPVFSGGELLAAIDVDEGGAIPPEVDKSRFIPFDFDSVDFATFERDSQGNFIIEGESYYIATIEGQNYFVPITQILNDTATFTFTVDNDLGNVENLDVRFSVEHSSISNLEVNLESPQGQEVKLFSRVGGDEGRNFQDTVLDDDASKGINFGNAPLNRTYRPQGSLADFNGENSTGTWTLKVKSFFLEGNNGTLYKAGETTSWGTAIGTQLLLRNPLVQSGGGRGSGNSGAINLEATHGDLSVGNIRSFSETGNGGRVDIKANNNIITGLINSASRQGNGGAINLNAISGNILTYSLDASSVDRDGGNIQLEAAEDITTADIITESGEFFVNENGTEESNSGSGNAGSISIESTAGSIDTEGSLKARSVSGNGANVEIKALQDISTAEITTESEQSAGDINLESKEGAINIQAKLDASSVPRDFFSSSGDGGNIEIKAAQDITIAGITTESRQNPAGNISIESQEGAIDTTGGFGFVIASSFDGNGGNIEIRAAKDISTGYITTESVNKDAGNISIKSRKGAIAIAPASGTIDAGGGNNGGNVEIKAAGDITTRFINTYSPNGNAGNITIESTEGAIDTSMGIISASSFDGNGGNVEIKAAGDITTTSIFTDSGAFTISQPVPGSLEFLTGTNGGSGNAGNITIKSKAGSIDTTVGQLGVTEGSIKARSVLGNGGDITMTAGGDIITQQVESFSSSMSERNLGNGGDITMTAGGDIINTVWLDSSFADTSSSRNNLDRDNSGNAGNITLSAGGDIIAGWLVLYSWVKEGNSGDGGDINLKAEGNINTYSIDAYSFTQQGNSGDGGSITLNARGNINLNTNQPEFSVNTNQNQGAGFSPDVADRISNLFEQGLLTLDREKLAIRTFSAGTNDSGNGGDVNITTNNLSNTEIFTLSSHSQSGQVTIENQPQGNLLLNDLSIITSQQLSIPNRVNTQETEQNPFVGPLKVDAGIQGRSGDVSIISNGNLNLNNVTIESDTKGDNPAGNVNITSLGNITLDNTDILSITSAQGNAGNITLETDQNIRLTNSSRLQASTEATGNAGTINILANNLNLDQSTSLITETLSAGNPGAIAIEAQTIDIGQDAQISATVVLGSTSTGDGGNITISTNELNITGRLGIFAETEASANAGTLSLSPYENNPDLDINFSNDGFISASTSSIGNGGNIFITAPENIDISGQGFIAVETSGTGDAGIIEIQTDNLRISDGVSINASTTGAGNAGQIKIDTTDFTLEKGTSLTTETNSAGKAGDITINSPTVTIGENASISATALEKATNTETGGNISIFSNTLNISGELGIFAQTEGESPAGTLTLKPYSDNPDLDINFTNRGFISASTSSTGNGGNINIFAPETIDISGDGKITVETTGSGSAGDIEINTGSLTVTNGAEISANTGSNPIDASSNGNGVGGNIIIEATEIVNLDNNARLSVETRGAGKSGNIEIYSPEVNVTTDSRISADAREGATNREAGGNITIGTNTLNISSSEIFAQTQGETPAGTITLKPYNNNSGLNINFTNEGTISANTLSTGDGGNIFISAPETIDIVGEGQIVAGSNGAGKAGNIEINSQQLTIAEDARIRVSTRENSTNTEGGTIDIYANIINVFSSESSDSKSEISAETESETSGGTITLKPYEENSDIEINFSNDSRISARTLPTATGNAGNIDISAPENIKISGDGKISAENSGAGRGGNITVEATESIELRNLEISVESTRTATGNAGEIRIETQELTIADGTSINASTKGTGNAGAIDIDTQTFTLETGTSLTTETESAGQAGDITINSERLTIGREAEISATALEGATNTEAGGNITINANDVLISGLLGIFAETAGDSPAGTLQFNPYRRVGEQGSRGVRTLHATSLREFDPNLDITFTENGFISARTRSIGNGGNINIFAPENINISGEGRITVETQDAGNAGIININTENLTIAENTTISAATSDTGDGGSININSNQTFQLEGQIITETTGTGNGGIITINTGEMTAPNSTISAQSTAAGNAGEINISSTNNITTGIITSEANNRTETADGGDISIISEQGEINATQPIQSFSNRGNAGDVTLTAQNDITTNIISSHGQQQGGQITITSETGNIDTSNGEFLANYSGGGDAGNVTLTAPQGNITTTDIYSFADGNGGQILLKAGGDINITNNSNIISASEPREQEGERGSGGVGRGGDIILEAGNNINTTTAQIYSGADIGDTGKIDIIGEGAIETGKIDLASGFERSEQIPVNNNFTLIPLPEGEATQGVARDITLRSNNSTIDTTAGSINSRSPDGTGNISLNARDNITTGKLEASALNESQPTTGGDVNIISQQGEINATQAIETFSAQGTAGSVNIMAEASVNIENILSQGTERGGDIIIDSRSENSINAQGALNTFSTAGTAGNVTLTSPGSITINGIRSDGMQQGGTITVESEIGEINSTADIESFSDQGIGGNVTLTAPESVNLANVSSFGATESGDLIIQSRTATVNTGNVTTQAPAGSSGSIIINGTEVGTGDLSSIGTTSAGEINVEATDGSIRTYDIEISSDGTIGDLTLRATEDVATEDINQNAGEGDANTNIDSGEDQTTGDINQTADNDANNIQTAGGDLNTGDINQTADNDTNNIQTAGGDLNTGDINQTAENDTNNIQTAGDDINTGNINQTAGNDANNIQTAGGDINTPVINQNAGNDTNNIQTAGGDINTPVISQNAGNNTNNIQTAGGNINTPVINQTAGNESITIQNPQGNQNIDITSVIPNNNNSTIQPIINQNNPQNYRANPLNNPTNNTTINSLEINTFSTTTTSDIISTTTPSNNNQTINTATAKEQTDSSINNTTDTQEILNIIDTVNTNPLAVATGSDQIVTMLEENRIKEYSDYFGEDLNEKLVNTQNVRDILTDMAAKTGKESAVVYINAYDNQIQIILFTKDGQPILKTIPTVNREKLWKNAIMFSGEIIDFRKRNTTSYLPLAQKLYNWLIGPISDELEAANIDTILFSMDSGFRLLPLAALHDGEQFLIEKYSISLIPSVSLMDSRYNSVKNTKLLGMGASQFTDKSPLPAVPIELQTISEKLWQGNIFLNEEFTKNNLINELSNDLYPIVHLATHAEFRAGDANDSYVQLWDDKLGLDEVRKLRWNSEKAELLVLSACRTAVGDRNAELGFAGLAIAAGVKSALGSFWLVSDEGTLGLMTEFYAHLSNVKIKAEALREAQLAMLRGEVVITDGNLRGSGSRGEVSLPSELATIQNKNFAHPYYWAGFTMVGSPW